MMNRTVKTNSLYPLCVGVWDGPLDLDHPHLRLHIDRKKLRSLFLEPLREGRGETNALVTLEQKAKKVDFQSEDSFHATAVAGIILGRENSPWLKNVSLFPIIGRIGREKTDEPALPLEEISWSRIYLHLSRREQKAESLLSSFDQRRMQVINHYIKKANLKIVNLSTSIFEADAKELRSHLKNSQDRKANPFPVTQLVHLMRKARLEFYKTIIVNNPQTIFVISAGNENTNLNSYQNFKTPNMIVVGNINKKNLRKCPASNFGSRFVDVGAHGTKILTLRPESPEVNYCFSGTSASAPLITHLLMKFWGNHPHLQSHQLLQEFLATQTKTKKGFLAYFIHGRYIDID